MPHYPEHPVAGIVNSAFVESQVDLTEVDGSEEECHTPEVASTSALYDLNQNMASAKQDIEKKSIDEIEETLAYEVQSSLSVFCQMLIPFTIAGFGSVGAGIVLNIVHQWPVFKAIPQLSIMVSAFLGLIGNIETTYASRLSTQANLGRLDHWNGIREIITGNLLVVQCQASTVGLFAAATSLFVSTLKEKTRQAITAKSVILLCSTSVITSIIANTLLATTIAIVILGARKFRINPDNISTPVAASMGDVCTIAILAYISQWLYDLAESFFIQLLILAMLMFFAPVFGYYARQNRWTHSVIYTGWTAILGAVIFEQPGGVVMESAFEQYKVMSTFQPLVNGIGSNLVGIQTSRMSTFLHATSKKGELPESNSRFCVGPFWVFFSKDTHARMARLLLSVIIPAHLFYMAIIYGIQDRLNITGFTLTIPFVTSYLCAVVTQLILLLYLAYVSVFWAWKHKINPDNSAIPFTSALADVLGNCLMAFCFTVLQSIHDPNANVIENEERILSTTVTPILINTLNATFINGTWT